MTERCAAQSQGRRGRADGRNGSGRPAWQTSSSARMQGNPKRMARCDKRAADVASARRPGGGICGKRWLTVLNHGVSAQGEAMGMPAVKQPISVTRDELYELVWSSPMAEVAAKFGVSGSYLTRICKALNVPQPRAGHWAKVAAGQASPPRCPLPAARPGDPQVWQRGAWPPQEVRVDPVPPDPRARRKGLPKGPLPGRHPLLAGVKELLDEARRSYRADYQKPRTGKLVDVVVSKSGIDAALQLANQIYLALEARGHRVVLAPRGWGVSRPEFDEREKAGRRQFAPDLWGPSRLTTAYLGSVPMGLTIVELSERAEFSTSMAGTCG